MEWASRLRKLEQRLAAMPRVTDFRVAGRSRTEVFGAMLGSLFSRLEQRAPGTAAAFLTVALSGGDLPSDWPAEFGSLVVLIQTCEQVNPGLPGRVLEAVLRRADVLTEEMLFPAGRPREEETYYSGQGQRFALRL